MLFQWEWWMTCWNPPRHLLPTHKTVTQHLLPSMSTISNNNAIQNSLPRLPRKAITKKARIVSYHLHFSQGQLSRYQQPQVPPLTNHCHLATNSQSTWTRDSKGKIGIESGSRTIAASTATKSASFYSHCCIQSYRVTRSLLLYFSKHENHGRKNEFILQW